MNVSTGFRAAARPTAVLAAVIVLGACADAGGPLAPEPSSSVPSAYAALTAGTYETRTPLLLASGESVYLVGVYFGAEPDEATYLAQVGVSAGGSSRLLMEQDTYTYAGGDIEFAALVERGTLRENGRVLDATLVVDGQRVEVALVRK